MKRQILFPVKNKINIINLSSTEFSPIEVKVKDICRTRETTMPMPTIALPRSAPELYIPPTSHLRLGT